ncbi:hypothetical protein C0J52_26757 [Blattella germanica]|nr:hypothetical protein C0J52_26757 [Blattella germanica]
MKVLTLILVFALAVAAEESPKEKKVDKRGLLGLGYGYGHTEYGHSIVHPPAVSYKVPLSYGYGHGLYGYGLGYDYAPVYKTVHYSPSYSYGGYGHGYYGHGYGHYNYY